MRLNILRFLVLLLVLGLRSSEAAGKPDLDPKPFKDEQYGYELSILKGWSGVLLQIKVKPCVEQRTITGWEIESMGLAGLTDGEAGLKPGDMFTAIDGQGVLSVRDLVQVCSTLQEDQVCQFTVQHEGGGTHFCQLTLVDPIKLAKQGPGGGP